jgi:subtilisin family serine protease
MSGKFPIYRLPPFRVHHTSRHDARGQQVDWSHGNFGVDSVHLRTKGQGIKVAILDTGVDLDHPDLRGNVVLSKDFTGKGTADDGNGHGTHVAGIVAAIDNSVGVIGVAPEAKLVIGKVLGDDGSGFDNNIAKAIDWAVDVGADVISLSLGSPQYSAVTHGAILEAVKSHHVAVVAAAGNSGFQGVDYPGKLIETVAVAAVDKSNRRADFSSVGSEVDIAGPGVQILSTYPDGRVATLSGTSMATPFVAGVIACVLSYRRATGQPDLTHDELRQLLQANAADAGQPGRDGEYGWGLIRPEDMLGSPPVVDPPPPPPVDPGDPEPPWQPVKRLRKIVGTVQVDLNLEYE